MAVQAKTRPAALTIAGSDPGGGAGIQADVKTFAALGVYGFSALTQVIAQNSSKVFAAEAVSPEMVAAQIEAVAAEYKPAAIKTGALANARIVDAVVRTIRRLKLPAPVVDPVMISSSRAVLLDSSGEAALKEKLLPMARIVTPNIPEAENLAEIEIDDDAAVREAARLIVKLGARAVVIKGGHLGEGADAIDVLFDGRDFVVLRAARLKGGGAHGTGCAFAAAIAAHLARGSELEYAVRAAKRFVTEAMRKSFRFGGGRPLLDHFASRAKR